MNKAFFIVAAGLGLIATSSVSHAANLVIRDRHVVQVAPAPQVFSLRRSYPGFRPMTPAMSVVECPSPHEMHPYYLVTDALYCRRR